MNVLFELFLVNYSWSLQCVEKYILNCYCVVNSTRFESFLMTEVPPKGNDEQCSYALMQSSSFVNLYGDRKEGAILTLKLGKTYQV
jgi:hypothetical protein